MADHCFLVRRQDGLGPHPDDHPCASCGQPKSAPVHIRLPAKLRPGDAEAVARNIDFCLEAGDITEARAQLSRLIYLLAETETPAQAYSRGYANGFTHAIESMTDKAVDE